MSKMNIRNVCIVVVLGLLLILQACGDQILNKEPQSQYAATTVWSDINLAENYLLNCYGDLRIGFNEVMMPSITDNVRYEFTWGPENYVGGLISPDRTEPFVDAYNMPNWSSNFSNIQTINIFLSNIDDVADAYEGAKKEEVKAKIETFKGEALFLRAFNYAQLACIYGGVPIMKEPNDKDDDFGSIKRATFRKTIEFISTQYDEAAKILPEKDEASMGRATKGAALALKSRLLLFAASDLTADGTAANKFVGYKNPDRTVLWTAAKDAAKEVIDLDAYELTDFGAPDKEKVAQNYYDYFKKDHLSNVEDIFGKLYLKSSGDNNQMNLWNGPNGNNNWAGHNPTQDLVDSYQMEDGSGFFEHFKIENNLYKNISGKYSSKNIYDNREPRFYGTILYDGAVFQPRFSTLKDRDPVGIYDRATVMEVENGEVVSKVYGIDTRKGPVESWNGSYTGYVFKKYLNDEVHGKNENNVNAYIEIRYPEVLLNYAEALIELGRSGDAKKYINRIRNRAALPDFTGNIREALRYERRIELVFEGQRWYDIRRWKILDESLHDAKGINIVERHVDGNVVKKTWERITAEQRNFNQNMYWAPIPTDEMNKAPQLTQNPGY